MLILSLLIMQAAVTPDDGKVVAPADRSIVVNGRSLRGAQQALDQCIAAHCSPDKEIGAAIRYANQKFIAGDYVGARSTIAQSRRRNDRYAKMFPEPVSDLARAEARLASLIGRPSAAMAASLDAVGALKAGMAADDPTVMLQRLELGDQFARQGRLETAAALYEKVAAQGRSIGNPAVEGHALFRQAVLFTAVASVDPLYRSRARKAIMRLKQHNEPAFAPFKEGLTLLAARLKVLESKRSTRDAALSQVAKAPLMEPVLMSEPFVDLERAGLGGTPTGGTQSEWADVGFWVKPDGRVTDVAIRAISDYTPGPWLPLKLKSVAERRYAPFAVPADAPGLYRIERYSMVYDYSSPITSRIAVRSSIGRIDTTYMSSTYAEKQVPVK